MDTIVFFPPWPKMFNMLKEFLNLLKSDNQILVFGRDEIEWNLLEDAIALAYSAGAIELLEAVREHRRSFKKIIFIAPAGTANSSLLVHCFRFFKEAMKTGSRAPKIIWEALKNIIKNPLKSLREINAIRKFNLAQNLRGLEKEGKGIDFKVILSQNDYFLGVERAEKFFYKKHELIERRSKSHFGILELPRYFCFLIHSFF